MHTSLHMCSSAVAQTILIVFVALGFCLSSVGSELLRHSLKVAQKDPNVKEAYLHVQVSHNHMTHSAPHQTALVSATLGKQLQITSVSMFCLWTRQRNLRFSPNPPNMWAVDSVKGPGNRLVQLALHDFINIHSKRPP